ncbi:hypothetical protein Cma02nite_18410 [Cellulomonas marina]|nr:CHC2 zinc finger domain-containing protein [Cellulomonas marina]GIG29241.1 hypothetical protein Cma02nite_18410 [Cellulomonas marina]
MTVLSASTWGPQTSLDRVYNALEAAGLKPSRRSRDFKALCPVHDERTGSLHVTWRPDGDGGRVMLYCHGCQADAATIAEALGLTLIDLFDNPPPERDGEERWRVGRGAISRRAGRRRGRLGPLPRRRAVPEDDHEHAYVEQIVYPYLDADDVLVQEVVRSVCTREGCTSKTFTQRYVDHTTGEIQAQKPAWFAPVLYRLPAVQRAVSAGQAVWLLEGEKDVATAEGLGLVATTNTGGGKNFAAELAAPLAGAVVNVVLDRDGTGWARGLTVHERLTAAGAAEVHLLLPATTARKSDFTDHIAAGHSLDELVEVDVDDVRVWDATARVEDAYERIIAADDEIAWHLTEVQARRKSAPKTAEEHTRYAERWVAETEVCWEKIHDAAEEVTRAAVGRGSAWVLEAQRLVERLLQQATAGARAAHERAGKPLPPALSAAAAEPAPSATPDVDDAGASARDNVIDFPGRESTTGGGGTGGGGAGGGGHTSRAPYIERRDYRLVDGRIVEVRTERNGTQKFVQILNLDLHLDGREYMDTSSDVEDEVRDVLLQHNVVDMQGQPVIREERRVSHYLFSYTDPRNGERVQLRVEEDRARSGDFLDAVDLPGLEFDHSKTGKTKVLEAVRQISKDSVDHVQYRGTGWRLDPTHGWVYVTYTGLITARGVVSGHQLLQGVLARYALPHPTQDADELRRFFLEDSAALVDRFGGRIGAVLLGQAYVAPVRRNPYSVVVVGSNGSKKTGLCALSMHHFGTAWDRSRPTASMTGNGSTLNSVRLVAHQAKDAVAFFDDVTPGGNSTAAQVRLGEMLQLLFNQEVRDRASRDGDGIRAGHVPHASGLFSSELMPKFGANARRALVVPLQRDELQLDDILHLDRIESRLGRATLQASMIGWAARDLERARQIVRDAATTYGETLRAAGRTSEEAEAAAYLWAGWTLMTTFLVDVGALELAEQRDWLQRAHQGLHEAIEAAQDPDSPLNAGLRLRELIASSLRSGVAHLTDVTTDDAPSDEGLAIRLGWRRVNLGMNDEHGYPRRRLEAKGLRAGYVNADAGEVLLDATSLESLIKASAAGLSEPFSMDAGTARRALHEVGVLKAQWDSHGAGRWRYTMKRTIACESSSVTGRAAQRMVTVLDLAALMGDEDDPTTPQQPTLPLAPIGGPPTPQPTSDGPFDGSPAPEPVSDTPAPPAPTPEPHEETDVESPDVAVTLLPEPGECSVCHHPARTAVGNMPVHAECWGAIARGDDEAFARIAGEAAEPQPAAVEPQPTPEPQAAAVEPQAAAEPATAAARAETVETRRDISPTSTRTAVRAGAPRPSATTRQSFAAAAAVVDAAGVHLSNGDQLPLPPIRHLGDLAELGYELRLGTQVVEPSRAAHGYADPGVVVVGAELAEQLGITTRGLPRDGADKGAAFAAAHTDHPALRAALEDGWCVAERVGTDLRGWTKMWRAGQPSVYVTFADLLPPSVRSGDADAATVARRLGLFSKVLGTGYHLSQHATGLDLMQRLRVKAKDEFVVHTPPRPALALGDPDLNWARPPMAEEAQLTYVHAYDRGGAHLAGVAGLELPVGEPTEFPEGRPFDPRLPGYWFVEIPASSNDWRFPHPLFKGMRSREFDWVTTPTLTLANELGYDLEVRQAWVWEQHARVLDPWYKRITAARTATDDESDPDLAAVRTMLKELYTRSIGMMGSRTHAEGTTTFYPERRHHIVAKARANLLRRIVQIGQDSGVWPLAVKTDTVVYASAEPDPIKAWPGDPKHLGRGLGQFKVEGTGLLADQLPHLQGPSWPDDGKALLTGRTPDDGSE